ncbi:hypothetical protein CAPTEDRAFT_228924 [Capitella teleta]|uniref:Sialomucin core protein 24 n=1 Tax=Capitella teleta TaxID=283909 RepID=R7TTH3_CAPTE|nr:hypothetical protein CAPTEDRAFT_228924 [Capitella teleta]|eukprot:ELT96974.1 hypothetical protein CAPTEDRAFT_228924 [Capitella teleta]
MQLIAVTVFILAGLTVSSAQNCTDYQSEEACCDDVTCAFAACGDAVEASCVNATQLTDPENSCFNKPNNCSLAPTPPTGSTSESTGTTMAVTNASTAAPATNASTPPTTPVTVSSATSPTEDPSTSAAPNTTIPSDPSTTGNPPSGQTFDAASFIGGIVLAVGVIGIIFLGCKFFRAKSEQSYHQF